MSLQNLGKISNTFKTVLDGMSDGDSAFKILGEMIGETIDNDDFVRALKSMGATADDMREALIGKGLEPKEITDIMDALADSSTFVDNARDAFDGFRESLKKTGEGIGSHLKKMGSSLLSFATSPAGVGTIALLTTLGVGLAALKLEYDKSFDGLTEKYSALSSATEETESTIASLTSNIERKKGECMNHKFITIRIPNLLCVFKIILDFLHSKCYTNSKGRCDTMASVYDVACWFLSKQSMTHKKVQKMCYYAQAWHCALIGKPLFNEEIQAWVHGPVIPKLYPKFADYGWNEISITSFEEPQFDDNALKVLEAVYETYGEFSGDQLESLTHSENPWISARGNLKPWENCTIPITVDSMKAYYWQKYEESQND